MPTSTCMRSTWSRSPQLQDSEPSTRKTVATDMAIMVGLNLLWSPEMNIDNLLQSSSVDSISNRVYCSCIASQRSTSFGWQNGRRVCERASSSLREVLSALYHETTETLQCSYHNYWHEPTTVECPNSLHTVYVTDLRKLFLVCSELRWYRCSNLRFQSVLEFRWNQEAVTTRMTHSCIRSTNWYRL